MNPLRRVLLEAGFFRSRAAFVLARIGQAVALDNLRRDLGLPAGRYPRAQMWAAIYPYCMLYSVPVPQSPEAIRALGRDESFRRFARRILEAKNND